MNFKKNKLLNRCFRAIFYGVGGAAGSRVFMALANIAISQVLGKEVFGKFSNINSTVNLFVTFSGIGISATITRYISANREDSEKQGMYIGTLSKICMAMSVILSLVLFAFAKQISQLSSGGTELTVYFRLVAIAVFFAAMSSIEQSIMLGYERFASSSMVQLIRCGLFLVLGFLLSIKFNLYGSVFALVITHFIQYAISLVLNKKYISKSGVKLSYIWNADIKNALFTFALPAFISGLFVLPVNWIGNAILTCNSGFEEMAVFYVANQWMTYITYVPSQMGQIRPIYTDLYVKKDMFSLKKIFIRTTAYTTLVAGVIGLGAIVFSKYILLLYGKDYGNGVPTFICMIIVAVIYTAQVQTGFILQAIGKMWISFGINAVWGITLLTSFCIMHTKGAYGYALSYVIAYCTILVIQWFIVNRFIIKYR